MERAKRQAAGPLRVILEASKSRRKGGEPESAQAAEVNSVRSVAARAPAPDGLPQAAVAPPPAAVTAPPRPPQAAAGTQITVNSEPLQVKTAAGPVPGLPMTEFAAVPAAAPLTTAAVSLPVATAALLRPRLISRVDPELNQRAIDDLGRNAVVRVDLTIRADGTVAAVTPVGPLLRSVLRPLISALEQWRFDPLPQERVHRVELVFNEAQ